MYLLYTILICRLFIVTCSLLYIEIINYKVVFLINAHFIYPNFARKAG